MRTIKQIAKAFKVKMGDVYLDQALPHRGVDQIDPFLLIHHWAETLKGGKTQSQVGVGPHPHRGFAPVTFIFKGGVHHRDSLGTSAIVWEGGTQWMNSGSGIIHSERPPKELAENGGDFEIIQFWINAPAAKKMDTPNYQPIQAKETPCVEKSDGKASVQVVAGTYDKVEGPVETYSDMMILRLDLQAGAELEIPIKESYNAVLYQLDGALLVNDQKTTAGKDLTSFNNDGISVRVKATSHTRAILLTGEPIGEPTVSYGPFVMNTQEEIMQALEDYQTGLLGKLTEQFDQ